MSTRDEERRRIDGPGTPAARRRPAATRPRHVDPVVVAELERALDDPDPLRGIAHARRPLGRRVRARPTGVTRTKALGAEHVARKLRDALPSGDQPLRAALWTFLPPMLSPRLTALNRDAFVPDAGIESTVDPAAHRADADLDDLDLDLGRARPCGMAAEWASAHNRRKTKPS